MPVPGRARGPGSERGGAARAAEIRRYAIIGHPVAHSLSPRMQTAAFQAAGKNASYEAIDVPPSRLSAALDELFASGFAGLNVTLPHKEEALRRSRSATAGARAAGAANTLRRMERGWEAEATDGVGFLAWIASLGRSAEGSRALVLGAGGAARSVAAALAQRGAAAIRIVNRSPERAAAVAAATRAVASPRSLVEDVPWDRAPAGGGAGDEPGAPPYDLIVRALSVESVSREERGWWGLLAPGGILLDLNYGERANAAREEAGRGGLRYEDGLALLVEQGALSYEFWTGEAAPRDAMREALA